MDTMHSSLPNGSAGIDTPIVVDHLWTKQKLESSAMLIWKYKHEGIDVSLHLFVHAFVAYFVSTCAYLFLLHSGKVQRAFFKVHYQVTLFASLFDL